MEVPDSPFDCFDADDSKVGEELSIFDVLLIVKDSFFRFSAF